MVNTRQWGSFRENFVLPFCYCDKLLSVHFALIYFKKICFLITRPVHNNRLSATGLTE
jgi:hypothetical protein